MALESGQRIRYSGLMVGITDEQTSKVWEKLKPVLEQIPGLDCVRVSFGPTSEFPATRMSILDNVDGLWIANMAANSVVATREQISILSLVQGVADSIREEHDIQMIDSVFSVPRGVHFMG